eukprot:TRINITY_DN5630_c0_g1_i1.p1 TRINITY_DN5630_c0_g1~~TRINITY_DN5630_c0_g1_i1.p1  ORF type:complete len:796 (-),score=218.01 TRINITY_DN5630_c0_g1_i1:91-2478(-)
MTAAATRKLAKDIETVLKKVNEGMEEFDECWEHATSSNGAQKERLGEDLKKSINKLQRLRAQIREWIGQSGVPSSFKDKLEDARRRIESDMQRFKDFERDLKTKAFSTCALARTDELELEEAERVKYQDWLHSCLQTLKEQLDQFEADIEILSGKKSLSSDDKSRLAQLKTLQERHRWHIRKLEQLLRAVDNDAVEVSDLAVVRDSLDAYLENYEDYHDEQLYDCFDLTEFEEKTAPPRTPQQEAQVNTPASSKEEPKKGKDKEKRRKEDKKEKKKEDRKAASGAVVSKASVVRSPGPEVKTILEAAGAAAAVKADSRENVVSDEVKVQEEQLCGDAEEFICKICQIHVVGCSPKLTSCSHLFCGDCIAQWFCQHPESQTWAQRAKAAGPERVVPCPVCKQALNEKKDLYPVCGVTSRSENLLLWRMLSSLKIMCANHPKVRPDGKCEWIGEYGSYQAHAKKCKNEIGACFTEAEVTTPVAQVQPQLTPPLSQAEAPTRSTVPVGSVPQRASASPKVAPAAAPAMASQAVGAGPGTPAAAHSPAPLAPAAAPPATVVTPTAPAAPVAPAASAAPKAAAPPKAAPTVPAAQAVAAAGTAQGASARVTASQATPAVQSQAAAQQPHQRREQAQEMPSSPGCLFVAPAVSSFEPTGSNMARSSMSVRQGDMIQVLEQHDSGWTYAKNLSKAGNSIAGWVPSWIVQADSAQQAQEPAPEAKTARQAPLQQEEPAPAQEARNFQRANAAFTASSASQLTLNVGDSVEIVERHASGWTYGRKASDSGAIEGWFPDWVCPQK